MLHARDLEAVGAIDAHAAAAHALRCLSARLEDHRLGFVAASKTLAVALRTIDAAAAHAHAHPLPAAGLGSPTATVRQLQALDELATSVAALPARWARLRAAAAGQHEELEEASAAAAAVVQESTLLLSSLADLLAEKLRALTLASPHRDPAMASACWPGGAKALRVVLSRADGGGALEEGAALSAGPDESSSDWELIVRQASQLGDCETHFPCPVPRLAARDDADVD
eukprot:tig00021493_g21895.t2